MRVYALVAALLVIPLDESAATTLGLLQPDPADTTDLNVIVSVSDGFTSETAFNEHFLLADSGNGSLNLDPLGILTPIARVNSIQLDFGGTYEFSSTVGDAEIPISLRIDQASFTIRNQDGSPLAELAVGNSASIQVASLDAVLSGSVVLNGYELPFDFYGMDFSCSPCLDPTGFVPGSTTLSVLDLNEVVLEGAFRFPRADGNPIGSADGLTVRVRATTVVHLATFVPEPNSALLACFGLCGLAARRSLRRDLPRRKPSTRACAYRELE